MNFSNEFIIPFNGLKSGKHNFRFRIDSEFLRNVKIPDIERGDITADVVFNMQETLIKLLFSIDGTVNLICGRCTGYYDQPLSGSFSLIVKFGGVQYGETDDILVLPYDAREIDISHYLYEYINLLLPQTRVHPEGGCNKEMIELLKKYSPEKRKPALEQRWEKLKHISLIHNS